MLSSKLTGNASGNDDDVSASKSLLEAVIFGQVAVHRLCSSAYGLKVCSARVAYGGRGNVGEVGSNAGGVDDIVQGKFSDIGVGLEEQGQWLDGGQSVMERKAHAVS